MPVAARNMAWVHDRSLLGIASVNPAGSIDVCLVCVLSDSGLCGGPITHPEESYQVWCV